MSSDDILIAGGGCAGLSLAVHLLDAGVSDRRILLIEPRRRYAADRTWSFWKMGRHPFERCVDREWRRWRLRDGSRSVNRASDRHPYQRILSSAFYRHAVARLREASNVELRLGSKVIELRPRVGAVEVVTDRGAERAGLVFDGRPPARRPGADGELWQHFLGQEVVMPKPVFDPGTATLMDFAPANAAGVGFVYLLPSAPDRALVESTWISRRPFNRETYRRQNLSYLRRRHGAAPVAVEREEAGLLPMTRRPWRRPPSPRIVRIGTGGGAVRPATGYGFLAIQRSCARLARRVAAGARPAPRAAYRRRARLLDRVFLTYLRRHPERGPAMFVDLFDRVPPDSLVRFLADRGSWLDDLRVVRAMPGADLSAAALRMLRPTWARV